MLRISCLLLPSIKLQKKYKGTCCCSNLALPTQTSNCSKPKPRLKHHAKSIQHHFHDCPWPVMSQFLAVSFPILRFSVSAAPFLPSKCSHATTAANCIPSAVSFLLSTEQWKYHFHIIWQIPYLFGWWITQEKMPQFVKFWKACWILSSVFQDNHRATTATCRISGKKPMAILETVNNKPIQCGIHLKIQCQMFDSQICKG